MPRAPLLLDASVWFAAAHSPTGGSALVVEICQGVRYRAVVSQLLLFETLHNLRRKSTADAVARFYTLLAKTSPEMLDPPTASEREAIGMVTAPKDRYVLALARRLPVHAVITLDRRHLFTPEARSAVAPILLLTPAEFLEELRRSPLVSG